MDFTSEELKVLEKQLSCPEGENGIELGKAMHESNFNMTDASMKALHLEANLHFLEIGPGNSSHVQELFDRAPGMHYTGLEISETMQQEALRINQKLVADKVAQFELYDGLTLPFEANRFDRVMTVNTLYFWQEPLTFLQEVYRCLKPGGQFAIGFVQKETMLTLPFVQDRFTKYNSADLEALVGQTAFKIESIQDHQDQAKSKNGVLVDRKFSVALLKKH